MTLLTDTWTLTDSINAPTGRSYHSAVWNGSKMIVWGGSNNIGPYNTGGIYDIVSNTWYTSTSNLFPPSARDSHTAIWARKKDDNMGRSGCHRLGTEYRFLL